VAAAWPGTLAGRLALLLTSLIVLATAAVVVREYRAGEARLVAEAGRTLSTHAGVAAERLQATLEERARIVSLWATLETSQDLAVDDVDKRVSLSLSELVSALGSGSEAVASRSGGPLLSASDPARLGDRPPPLPDGVLDALTADTPGLRLTGGPGGGAVVASADVVSHADGHALGRIVVWTPLDRFLAAAIPLELATAELTRPGGHVLARGGALTEPDDAYLWARRQTGTAAGPLRISVARPRSALSRTLRASGLQLVTLAGIFLLLSIPVALLVARSATSGLARITRAARNLDAHHPGPLPPASPWAPTEVRVLSDALNGMVERLERAREELARSESLAAVGMLTKSLAHEIRTPLAVLRAGTEMLQRAPGAGARELEVGAMLQAEVGRLSRLADDLLVFGRPSTPSLASMDLHEASASALEALATDLDSEMDVHLVLEGEATPMVGDPDQLRQVVVNLAGNGARASDRGGTVVVRTGLRDGTAVLEVEDDGAGIPPERMDEIWKPLVTTHRSGTGLGLPIVKQLVEAHGGSIELESTPGEGTRVTVLLPADGASAA
jgi:signal transduction histidine kinase